MPRAGKPARAPSADARKSSELSNANGKQPVSPRKMASGPMSGPGGGFAGPGQNSRFPMTPMRPYSQPGFMPGAMNGPPPPQPRPGFMPGMSPSPGMGMGAQPPMGPGNMAMSNRYAGPPMGNSAMSGSTQMGPGPMPFGASPRVGMSPALHNVLEQRPSKRQLATSSSGGPVDQRLAGTSASARDKNKKKRKIGDKVLSQRVRDLVPECEAYMDLLAFERKLDSTIMRKRLDIQEALKRPLKLKRKLRIFISNTFTPAKPETEDGEDVVPSWELRVEGRLIDESTGQAAKAAEGTAAKPKQKFSTYFKSLVIELDKELYGPDNHLVEWHRTAKTQETDGFQVKRPGDQNVKCTVLLMLDYQPPKFKLDHRLARVLGIHTESRPQIINALWQYIKTHRLQDPNEREYINCDRYFQQIFDTGRMKFAEVPQRLHSLLMAPDPVVINHTIIVEGPDAAKKTAAYDIEIETDDPVKAQMNSFLMSTQSQQEIASLDTKVHETVDNINQLKINREFFLSFANEPQEFITNWLVSQTRDLKTMTDVVGNPEEERAADYYQQPWVQEAVCRYFYGKVQQRRVELERALGLGGS